MGKFLSKDEPEYLRMIIQGNSNAGKTTLAASAGNVGDTLFLSYYSQPQVVVEDEYKFAFVPYRLDNIMDLNPIFDYFGNNTKNLFYKQLKGRKLPLKYDFIVLDGLNILLQTYMQILLRPDLDDDKPIYRPTSEPIVHMNRARDVEWGSLLNFTNSLVRSLESLPMHVITTALSKELYTGERASRRLVNTVPAIQGQGLNTYLSFANVLSHVKWDGKDSVLQIRQSKTVSASYRYRSAMPKDKVFLINTNMAQVMCLEPFK